MPQRFVRPRATLLLSAAIAVIAIAGCSATPSVKAAGAPVTVKVPVTVTASARTVSATVTETVAGPFLTVTETVTEAAVPATSTPDTGSATPTGLTVGGAGITATNDHGGATISALSSVRKTSGTGDYSKPPKNGNYVLIDVSYLCTTGTWTYNPFDWKLRDDSGRTYDASGAFSSGYSDSALHSGTVGASAKARGTLVFDAPPSALTLEFTAGFGNAPASWVIPA